MVHENKTTGLFPWVLMILMSSVTFVGITAFRRVATDYGRFGHQ